MTALLIGLSLGAEVDMISFLTSRYFGMKSYGRIYAVIYKWRGVIETRPNRALVDPGSTIAKSTPNGAISSGTDSTKPSMPHFAA